MKYTIMNFNEEIAEFNIIKGRFSETLIVEGKVFSPNAKQLLRTDITSWVQNRKPFNKRAQIDKLLSELGIKDLEGYFNTTYGLTLNDALWIKPECQSKLCWERVNLYKNPFNELISHFAFEGSGYVKGSTSPEFGTDGMLPKCWKRVNGGIYLYKGGSAGAINAGKEPFSEAYVSQLLEALDIDKRKWVKYECIEYHKKNVSRCKIFTSENIGFKTQSILGSERTFEKLFEYQMNSKWAEEIKLMYIIDALIVNDDRHLNNYGYLINNKNGTVIGFSPLFDNGAGCITYFYSNSKGVALDREIDRYTDNKVMSSGVSFVEVAKACMTKQMKSRILNLKDFKFKRVKNDTEQRVYCINRMLQRQIRKIV